MPVLIRQSSCRMTTKQGAMDKMQEMRLDQALSDCPQVLFGEVSFVHVFENLF